jgi:probable phosphoglycerate mutase
MTRLPDILLFRHAATDMGKGPRRYIGRTEVPLSDEGRAQAAAWRARMAGLAVARAYASPLARARDTALLMLGQAEGAHGGGKSCDVGGNVSPRVPETRDPSDIPFTILPDLAELDIGEWDGLVQSQVRETQPEAYARRGREPWTFRPPGGECCADAAARGLRALAAMLRDCVGEETKDGGIDTVRDGAWPSPAGAMADNGPFVLAVTHAGLIRAVLCALGRIGRDELFTLPVRHLHCVRLRAHGAGWRVVSADWTP